MIVFYIAVNFLMKILAVLIQVMRVMIKTQILYHLLVLNGHKIRQMLEEDNLKEIKCTEHLD